VRAEATGLGERGPTARTGPAESAATALAEPGARGVLVLTGLATQ
jgi:hypothetical protein